MGWYGTKASLYLATIQNRVAIKHKEGTGTLSRDTNIRQWQEGTSTVGKRAGYGSMHGSADPDPHLNVMDQQLCLIQIRNPDIFSALSNTGTLLFRWPQVFSVGTGTHLNSERMDPDQQRYR